MAKKEKPHWIGCWGPYLHHWQCSECSRIFDNTSNYCPNCGASMRKKKGGYNFSRDCSICEHNTGETCDWWECDYKPRLKGVNNGL